MTDWDSYLRFAIRLADRAAEITLPSFRAGLAVADKSTGPLLDPVTRADREAERAMRALIAETYPDHGILGEEYGEVAGTGSWRWILDPIDGTRSYICGMPLWGTLIALNHGGRPIIGVADLPALGERFVGGPKGSFLGTRRLRTRGREGLEDAVMFTTDPDMFTTDIARAAYGDIERRVRLRRFGGDCYGYCMLAYGLVDLVVEGDIKPYDIQPLIPVIEGAGGRISRWNGTSAVDGGLVVAAGDAELHARAVDCLRLADPD